MARYTTQVRNICESYAGLQESKGGASVNEIIEAARSKIFDFNYPIFDPSYKGVLETKILKHYYTREICAETAGRWKLFLDARLNEIMPRYNKLYESELLEFNPLYDVDYQKTGNTSGSKNGSGSDSMTGTVTDAGTNNKTDRMTGTITDNATDTKTDITEGSISDAGTKDVTRTDNLQSASTNGGQDRVTVNTTNINDHWDMYADTPQGSIANIRDETYLTNARHITDTTDGSHSVTTTEFGATNTTRNTGTQTTEEQNSNITEHDMTNTINGTSENLKTYNTTDTINGTSGNTRTYNTTNEKTDSITNSGQYAEHVVGKRNGTSYSKLIQEFRETFLNIDLMIINELQDLFFGLYE